MRKILFSILLLCAIITVQAQFSKATLQASGLTCALCTKAINKSLEQLSFVASVTPDIKTSSFNIKFKDKASVDIDALKKGVEDAGFSVAKLQITGILPKMTVKNDSHQTIAGKTFHFLSISDKKLEGEHTLTIVDRSFLQPRDFKKYSASSTMSCVQTGVAGECCQKDGLKPNTRIYHVTI